MSADRFKKPEKGCNDRNCPFHGELSVRRRVLEGVVISDEMDKTVVVRRDYLKYVSKFKRYERRRSHISAHSPPCINAKRGDRVMVQECRPISKTVSFVVVKKLEER